MTSHKHGCCVDKVCTKDTCMELPEGESCGTCVHRNRCVAMFGSTDSQSYCGFFPRRFRKRLEVV